MPPRYNIAPTQPIALVRLGHDGKPEGMLARWGLVPSWVKDPKNFTLIVNARSETAAEKPSFRAAMKRRRILIPASGFYEWQRFDDKRKSQPYWVHPVEEGPVAFGGLLETWIGADGSELDSACILTTPANDNFSHIHHRMPLTLKPDQFEMWLAGEETEPDIVQTMLVPPAPGFYEAVPISDAVNKVANSGPEIQKRVEPMIEAETNTEVAEKPQLDLF